MAKVVVVAPSSRGRRMRVSLLFAVPLAQGLVPGGGRTIRVAPLRSQITEEKVTANEAQTQQTSRDTVMTFAYDTEREREYEKPVYKGTGDGMGGKDGECVLIFF